VTCKTGFGLDLLHIIHTTPDYRQYSASAALHNFSSPMHTHKVSQSLIVVSWQRIYNSLSFQITYAVFFSQLNSILAINLQLPIEKTRLNSIPLIPSSYPGRLASRNSTLHSLLLFYPAEHFLITTQPLLLRRSVY
jgi:hypothetical protein